MSSPVNDRGAMKQMARACESIADFVLGSINDTGRTLTARHYCQDKGDSRYLMSPSFQEELSAVQSVRGRPCGNWRR